MQIRPENLAAQLARSKQPLVWVHGDEPLLQIESADVARDHFRQAGFNERHVFNVDRSFQTSAVEAHTQALSLFSDCLLVELRWPAKPSREHGQWLAGLLAQLPDTVRLIATSARLDRNTLESDWGRLIDGNALMVAVFPVERKDLGAWVSQRLSAQRQRVDAETLALICDRVEGNLMAAQQEVRKLALLFGEGMLPAEEVREAVLNVARYDTADLAEAMLVGDTARALRSLQGLQAEGAAEPLVLWMLADVLRTQLRFSRLVDAGQMPANALRAARIFGPRERLYLQAIRQRAPRDWIAACVRGLRLAATADRRVKGVERGDAWQALESVILSVCSAAVPMPPNHRALA